MIRPEILLYVLIMAGVTYLVRLIPILLVKKQIKNQFLLSFLHYVPYACLTAMTFPAILGSTESVLSGAAALAVAVWLAYRGKSLITVALSSSVAVLAVQWLMNFI